MATEKSEQELPEGVIHAEVIGFVGKGEHTTSLAIRLNIEDQDRVVYIPLNELSSHISINPEAGDSQQAEEREESQETLQQDLIEKMDRQIEILEQIASYFEDFSSRLKRQDQYQHPSIPR